ncbi:MAG: hypothetical protein R6T92_05330 [Desulfosalsimonadaceae bacterium]
MFLVFSGCASAPLKQARSDFYGGRLNQAANALSEPTDVSNRDRLLFYMEKGVIQHHAGEYDKSIDTLLEASSLIRQQDYISAREQAGSMVTTERITEYKGEYAERLLVHTYLMMGFLLKGRPESALVEAKQALEVMDAFPEATARDHFTRALIAHCFEINGEINGAYIEYKNLAAQMKEPAPVADKLVAIAGRLGFSDDVEKWRKHLPDDATGAPTADAELVLFVGQGRAPVKIPRNIVLPPSIRFSFATYRERTRSFYTPHVSATSAFGPVRTVTTDVGRVLKDSLNTRLTRILAKETARVTTKEVLSQQIDDPVVEILVRVAFFLMEEPDTRAWETLPAYMTLIRVPLSVGEHKLTLHASGEYGGTVRLPPVTVSPNRRFYHYSMRAGFAPPEE